MGVRSYLYVPGNRPDRFQRALESGADAVIFDLEDAVPADGKDDARSMVADVLDGAAAIADKAALTGVWVPKSTPSSLIQLTDAFPGMPVRPCGKRAWRTPVA